MKKNTFTEDYRTFKTYEAEYRAAENEADREAVRKKVNEFYAGIDAKGKDYERLYSLYTEAQERGNEYIDIRDNIQDKDVKALINSFRKYGIEKFTFSSTWSSTAETAWLFLQNGCTLEGMTELHGYEKITLGKEREFETIHGYVFKIN